MDLYERLKKMKIVLVEDDPWIQNGLRMFFRYHECDLCGFESGALAMEALAKERVDVVICDYWLPDLDGLTILRGVRERQPDAICILITAYPSEGLREEAFQLGVHDFIPKPLTIQKLEASLGALIERSRPGEEVTG